MRSMASSLLFFLLIGMTAPYGAAADESSAFSPKLALKNDFKDSKYWPSERMKNEGIEFCGGDWCQEVLFMNANSREAAWDAIFLMFYFFDANDEFKARREALANNILDNHEQCRAGNIKKRASCVLEELQIENEYEYRRVQYDVGYRCASFFSAKPPHFTERGDCVRILK